ncbi:MAG: hypothetical protein AAFZ52_13300 [Bacteroidota bacterium]
MQRSPPHARPTLPQRCRLHRPQARRATAGAEEVSLLALAIQMEANGKRIGALCALLEGQAVCDTTHFRIEHKDFLAWDHLSLYFAQKLRTALFLNEAIKTKGKDL